MKKLALLSALAVLACIGQLAHVQASNKHEQPFVASGQNKAEDSTCSNATLEGVYGFSISGTRPAPAPPSGIPNYVPGTIENVIGVNTRTFDGAGSFTQIDNVKGSLSGVPFPNRPGSGPYTVNPDCSGTITLFNPGNPFPLVIDIVVVDHGREVSGVVVSPQTVMISTSGRKVK